jgi:hypothetical protein
MVGGSHNLHPFLHSLPTDRLHQRCVEEDAWTLYILVLLLHLYLSPRGGGGCIVMSLRG